MVTDTAKAWHWSWGEKHLDSGCQRKSNEQLTWSIGNGAAVGVMGETAGPILG